MLVWVLFDKGRSGSCHFLHASGQLFVHPDGDLSHPREQHYLKK